MVSIMAWNEINYTINLLRKMIEYPTISPAGNYYKEFTEFISKELEHIVDEVRVIQVPSDYQERNCPQAGSNPRYIILAEMNGKRESTLHFNGHYDVVPGGQGWTITSPFKPIVKNNKLYGRGAVDMKGGIAAVITALKRLKSDGKVPYHNIELAIVPDEEIGGDCGSGYLVSEVLKDRIPDYVIIPEPSGLEHPWHGHKGLLWVRVKVRGRNAHASTPWRGRNAFLIASRLALTFHEAYMSVLSSRRSRYKTIPEESMYPTIGLGGEAGVTGGGKTNQIPGEFYFTIDRRLIPEEKVEEVKREIEAFLRWSSVGLGGVEYDIDYTAEMEPAINDPGELYEALRRAARRIGVEVKEPVVCPGGLDLRYYTVRGAKTLSYGPLGETAHSPDEYVDLGELSKLTAIFYSIMVDEEVWVTR